MNEQSAIITASSGKSVEHRQAGGIFSCLMEHEVTKTKATFKYTGPYMEAKMWAQVMEFFEWTYATEKSESQVRLFVHPEHGWAAWAFPQEGGTFMTSKEEPMTSPDCVAQRQQFSEADGWLYWGTVHHHCSAGAFASGTDDANEKSQEGIHITIGHMDKPMRDFHCRMYLKEHKFEPLMHHFWQMDEVLLNKADEMHTLFGIYPDLNTAAKKAMCQNSTALYASLNPPWVVVEGQTLFPPQWKLNYKVRPKYQAQDYTHRGGSSHGNGVRGTYALDGRDYCQKCSAWTDHDTAGHDWAIQKAITQSGRGELPLEQLGKKERRRLRYEAAKKMLKDASPGITPNAELKKVAKAQTLLDDLEQQAAVMGVGTDDFLTMIEALTAGNNGLLMQTIAEELNKEKLTVDDLYTIILEREIRESMTEKEADQKAVQEQIAQANGGVMTGWEGGYGS